MYLENEFRGYSFKGKRLKNKLDYPSKCSLQVLAKRGFRKCSIDISWKHPQWALKEFHTTNVYQSQRKKEYFNQFQVC